MMTDAWSWFVIVLVALNIIAMVWLLFATSKSNGIDEASTTGHRWDGIEELNNPLPRWWLGLFVITIVFSVAYLVLYPGMGNFAGSLGWTQQQQFETARAQNTARQDAFFAEFADLDIPALAKHERAMRTGERLFLNNCATCHGSGAEGAKGFPNLVDNDWLYGNSPEIIVHSITNGRAGLMPDLKLPERNVTILSRYLRSLSGIEPATAFVEQEGKSMFGLCESCHGADGTGNQALGAPNLTDEIWLHGSSIAEIESVLANGIQGNMPSFEQLLSPNEIRLLAAYVLSLSATQNEEEDDAQAE